MINTAYAVLRIIADETTDVSRIEHMIITVRDVAFRTDNLYWPVERKAFIGFVAFTDLSGKDLSDRIVARVEHYFGSAATVYMVGPGFGGPANMRGPV